MKKFAGMVLHGIVYQVRNLTANIAAGLSSRAVSGVASAILLSDAGAARFTKPAPAKGRK